MPKDALPAILPCSIAAETTEAIKQYSEALREAAPALGNHGLATREFWDSGIFHAAIERLRGQRAATMKAKRQFVAGILDWLKSRALIVDWVAAGGNDRHDYEVHLPDGRTCCIEAKGCLDGNNTNIFQRPPNADEFVIWSLCQNPGADPRKNAWSGLHTRLSAEIVHRGEIVDGVVIWDMLCGTLGRPCPKLAVAAQRAALVGLRSVPPPCIYLFPRLRPDARNNPSPRPHSLEAVKFLHVLSRAFGCDAADITSVEIEVEMRGSTTARRTRLVRDGVEVAASKWTKIKRAR